MSSKEATPVLVIALDAAEYSLIERLSQEGKLPNISKLRQASSNAILRSVTEWFVAGPWPCFHTGQQPAEHGIYHYLPWNPKKMVCESIAPEKFSVEPFWRDLQARGIDTVIVDAPMVHPPPTDGTGIEICGWCTHDVLTDPWVYPAPLREELAGNGYEGIKIVESQRPIDRKEFDRLVADLNQSTSRILDLSMHLLARKPWTFALVSFTATHVAGHQLWGDTSFSADFGEDIGAARSSALESVYINCDRAVGQLVNSVNEDTTILLLSLHGMEANTNRGELLPEMLTRILSSGGQRRSEESTIFTALRLLRERLPRRWRHSFKKRLPQAMQNKLTGLWRTGGKEWSRTKAFAFVPDLQGYIRINLRGREAKGVVQPGTEYDELCNKIIDGLGEFVDADTGEQVVAEAKRMDEICPQHPDLSDLPDIAVKWTSTPCAQHREITSPYGSIPWPTPGRDFDGRSGNHGCIGFLAARGNRFEAGSEMPALELTGIAPTIYDLIGIDRPKHMKGKSIVER